MKQVKKLVVGSTLLGMLVITSGCGGGGGGSIPPKVETQPPTNDTTQVEGQTEPSPAEPPKTEPTPTPENNPIPVVDSPPETPVVVVKNLSGSVSLGEVNLDTLQSSSELLPQATVAVYQYPKLRGTPLCETTSDNQGAFVFPETCFPTEGVFVLNVTGGDVAVDADVRTITSTTTTTEELHPLKNTLHAVFTYQEIMQSNWQINLASQVIYQHLTALLDNTDNQPPLIEALKQSKENLIHGESIAYDEIKKRLVTAPEAHEFLSDDHQNVVGKMFYPVTKWDEAMPSNETFTNSDWQGDDLVLGVSLWATEKFIGAYQKEELMTTEEAGVLLFDTITMKVKAKIDIDRPYPSLRGVYTANDWVFVYDDSLTQIDTYNITNPDAPVDMGKIPVNSESALVTNSSDDVFFVHQNQLSRVTTTEQNTVAITEAAHLNQSALTCAKTAVATGDTAFILQRHFTPGIAKKYRVANEDLNFYLSGYWKPIWEDTKTERAYPEIPILPSLSAADRQAYTELGEDMATDDRYLPSDILLANLVERTILFDDKLRVMFAPSYLADSLVYTIDVYDIHDAAKAEKLSVPIRKQGQFIEGIDIEDHWLTLRLRSNVASKSVDRVELWDISEPSAPTFVAGYDEADYPLLVSPKTRFLSRNRAISVNKNPNNPAKFPAIRLFDTTDTTTLKILQTSTLPLGVTGDYMATHMVVDEEGKQRLQVLINESYNIAYSVTLTALGE